MSDIQTIAQPADHSLASTTSLILDPSSFEKVMAFAEVMAKGHATVPQHLRGNSADCAAVVMQSMQWQMNPFAVAQKTHVTQGGMLGYEGQLVNAVVIARAPIETRPEFTFIGDLSKILGRVEERKSDKGGKYYVAGWKPSEEAGLGVICSCLLKGEAVPREITVMMTQAYPRFSTQWATDPQQQITYLAVRKWARRYAPDVILGVYTDDEMPEAGEHTMRDMGRAEPATTEEQRKELPPYSDQSIEENKAKWQEAIDSGRLKADQLIANIQSKYTLSEQQLRTIQNLEAIQA
ncbi:RecT family recombinase [Pusillimonas sp. ANT_WB101]|uniref:RecT family recombinase n=1 Tax=Pusillimonas sp. ANT_WB101 TaxID=2597356 RepID=UPI0011EEBA94|nr:RecT family recombinase [Pusillimonas sp. ANT_WB101]KAA0910648.1 recombinase RecT [Pusillimonas sp. ANT_WB101]